MNPKNKYKKRKKEQAQKSVLQTYYRTERVSNISQEKQNILDYKRKIETYQLYGLDY